MRAKLKAIGSPGGIKVESVNNEHWINAFNEDVRKAIVKDIDFYKKYVGSFVDIEFDETGKFYKSIDVSDAEHPQPRKQESYLSSNSGIVNIKGKEYVTYKALLKKAHEHGLTNFEVLDKRISEDMKTAWVQVRAYFTKDGKVVYFDGMGSSTPQNTGEMTSDHPIEMAHTRAKGRALRDFLNEDTMAEELKSEDIVNEQEQGG